MGWMAWTGLAVLIYLAWLALDVLLIAIAWQLAALLDRWHRRR